MTIRNKENVFSKNSVQYSSLIFLTGKAQFSFSACSAARIAFRFRKVGVPETKPRLADLGVTLSIAVSRVESLKIADNTLVLNISEG